MTFVGQAAAEWLLQCLNGAVPHLPPALRVMRLGLVIPRSWSTSKSRHTDSAPTTDPGRSLWAEIRRRLKDIPPRIRIEFVSAATPQHPFVPDDIDAARAYLCDRLPGVAAQGRLSVFEDI